MRSITALELIQRLGLLTSEGGESKESVDLLAVEWKTAKKLAGRELVALQALVMGLRDHFPEVFKKILKQSPEVKNYLPEDITGQIIKLRRIAVQNLAKVV